MFELVDPVLDGLEAEVDAIHVSLEQLWVLVLQIDGPSWVLGNPFRLSSSSEKSRLGDKDVGMDSEAFGLCRRWVADDDVEGVLKIVIVERKRVAALMKDVQNGTYAARLRFAGGCSELSMVDNLLADLPPVLFLAVYLVRITVQVGWCDVGNEEKAL